MTWCSWLRHSSLVIGFIFVSGCGDNPSDDVSVLGFEGDDSRGEGFTITVGDEEPYHTNDPKELERLISSDASSCSITIKTRNAVSYYSDTEF